MIQVGGGGKSLKYLHDDGETFTYTDHLFMVLDGLIVNRNFNQSNGNFGVLGGNGTPIHGPGTARNAGAVYTATEQGMIQDMYNILRACGFLQP